jgi:hypothetical protein
MEFSVHTQGSHRRNISCEVSHIRDGLINKKGNKKGTFRLTAIVWHFCTHAHRVRALFRVCMILFVLIRIAWFFVHAFGKFEISLQQRKKKRKRKTLLILFPVPKHLYLPMILWLAFAPLNVTLQLLHLFSIDSHSQPFSPLSHWWCFSGNKKKEMRSITSNSKERKAHSSSSLFLSFFLYLKKKGLNDFIRTILILAGFFLNSAGRFFSWILQRGHLW